MQIQLPKNLTPSKEMRIKLIKQEDNVGLSIKDDEIVATLPLKDFTLEDGSSLFERRDNYNAIISPDGTLNVIRYTPLHGHSGYSMLDGASKTKDMATAAEYAMALTDHGNMFGALDFYNEMKKAGKKPILGFEAYSETIVGEKEGNHLLLIAENNQGYANLLKLVSESNENKKGKFNYVSYEMMEKYNEGVIATSACLGGELSQNIIRGNDAEALRVAQRLQEIFGKDNFFIEIQRHGLPEERIVNVVLAEIAYEIGAKIVATSDSHYTNEEDRESQEVLLCLSTNDTMDNPDRFKLTGNGYHIHTSQEMAELFKDMPEVLDNTLEISERSNVTLETDEIHMPHIVVPEKYNSEDEYFEALSWMGFEERFKGTEMFDSEEYRERLRFELDTITTMGFSGYFIIMWDVINFANTNDILVGPGRGSACGSLVSYVLQITDVNPIPYGLLFERFLNPDRYSMPDIDVDFPNTRREEIIEYTRQKYGEQSVARIVTYSTLSAKRVTRDVTKALSYPFSYGSKIADAIPDKPNISLRESFEESVEFSRLYEEDKDVRRIIDIALQLEGLPRNTSLHACGLVISNRPVSDYVPTFYMMNAETGTAQLTTQFDKDQVEQMGLLKMDFLGLKTLGVIDETLQLINEDEEEPITMRTIPVDDTATFQNIQKGNTSGVFQLEGPGMSKTVQQILDGVQSTPTNSSQESLLRLIAAISLYRPGPMDEIPSYVRNMKNKDRIVYETEDMENVLSETYGVIVYQEQVMQLVRDLAGFSRGQSDIVRKGMTSKVQSIMDEWGEAFIYGSVEKNIEGAVPRGIEEDVAQGIWDKMVKFSDYAFNKSHAAGYSFVSARTGWLATHHPVEFYTAMMNVYMSEKDKAQKYLATAKQLDIPILQPSVNKSYENFSVDGTNIRFGLNGISHVGQTAANIIKEREENGLFQTMQEFVVRMVGNHKLNSRTLNNLTFAGALDDFDGSRLEKINAMDTYLELGKFIRDSKEQGRATLFDLNGLIEQSMFSPEMNNLQEMDEELKLAKEREMAGFYITGHPLTKYQMSIDKDNYQVLSDVIGVVEERMEQRGNTFNLRDKVGIAGVVTHVETYYTKRTGDPMKVMTIEDETGTMKCIAFSSMLQEKRGLFEENDLLYLEGNVGVDDGEISFIINSAEDLHEMNKDTYPKRFIVTGHANADEAAKQRTGLIKWTTSLPEWKKRQKRIPVVFVENDIEQDLGIQIPYGYNELNEVREIVGSSALKVDYSEQ